MKKVLTLAFVMIMSISVNARNVTVTFKIEAGKCSYSRSTIKKVIRKMGGKNIEYNFKTSMVIFRFDNEEIDIMDIHKKLAEAGFETPAVKPTDHAYKMLPTCAQYVRK